LHGRRALQGGQGRYRRGWAAISRPPAQESLLHSDLAGPYGFKLKMSPEEVLERATASGLREKFCDDVEFSAGTPREAIPIFSAASLAR